MEAPTPEIAEATITMNKEESTFIVRNTNVAMTRKIAPKVVRFLVPYLSDNLPIIGLRNLPATYPGTSSKDAFSGESALIPCRYMITKKITAKYPKLVKTGRDGIS